MKLKSYAGCSSWVQWQQDTVQRAKSVSPSSLDGLLQRRGVQMLTSIWPLLSCVCISVSPEGDCHAFS